MLFFSLLVLPAFTCLLYLAYIIYLMNFKTLTPGVYHSFSNDILGIRTIHIRFCVPHHNFVIISMRSCLKSIHMVEGHWHDFRSVTLEFHGSCFGFSYLQPKILAGRFEVFTSSYQSVYVITGESTDSSSCIQMRNPRPKNAKLHTYICTYGGDGNVSLFGTLPFLSWRRATHSRYV